MYLSFHLHAFKFRKKKQILRDPSSITFWWLKYQNVFKQKNCEQTNGETALVQQTTKKTADEHGLTCTAHKKQTHEITPTSRRRWFHVTKTIILLLIVIALSYSTDGQRQLVCIYLPSVQTRDGTTQSARHWSHKWLFDLCPVSTVSFAVDRHGNANYVCLLRNGRLLSVPRDVIGAKLASRNANTLFTAAVLVWSGVGAMELRNVYYLLFLVAGLGHWLSLSSSATIILSINY